MDIFHLVLIIFGVVTCTEGVGYQIGIQRQKQTSFDKFDNTCGFNVPVIFNYTGLSNENGKLLMNTTITVKEDIPDTDVRATIQVEKCKSKDNLDTCEKFHDFNLDNYCVLLAGDNMWGAFFMAYTPRLKCPFRKGVYKAINVELDISAFLMFTQEQWYWKVHSELHAKKTNRLLLCLEIEAQISEKPPTRQERRNRPNIG